ncbi:MAG: amino acid ABC transporter [Hyphomicrobiales bacterium]|nr:MAG: amino acid ABC transporter [Hyphomicrobiales bacterium]
MSNILLENFSIRSFFIDTLRNKSQVFLFVAVLTSLFTSQSALAQESFVPNFWDKHERFVKPDMSDVPRLRFLTTTDFPPFNFIDRNKRLTGFNVDLARAICHELGIIKRCQIQALPWDELEGALKKGDGELILAGTAISEESRKIYNFSRPYFHIPGRFVTRQDGGLRDPIYDNLFKKTTGVVTGSAHEAYFSKVFGERKFTTFATRTDALAALQKGEVDAVFSDGLSLVFWLASAASNNCCRFVDGPFLSEEYFGKGLAVAMPKGNEKLKAAMDFALKSINDKGVFTELYLRYFPIGMF